MTAPTTFDVCQRCGLSAPRETPGWLYAQRIDQPEGHLIIRCPEHHTDHARRLAGLPQQYAQKTGYAAQKKYARKMRELKHE